MDFDPGSETEDGSRDGDSGQGQDGEEDDQEDDDDEPDFVEDDARTPSASLPAPLYPVQLVLEAAEIVLTGSRQLSPSSLVQNGTKGRESVEEVMTRVRHIIINDPVMAELISNLQADCHLVLNN